MPSSGRVPPSRGVTRPAMRNPDSTDGLLTATAQSRRAERLPATRQLGHGCSALRPVTARAGMTPTGLGLGLTPTGNPVATSDDTVGPHQKSKGHGPKDTAHAASNSRLCDFSQTNITCCKCMLTCSWHRSKKEIETEIKKCFDLFDSDHSGKLDAKELAAVATTLGQV